MDRQQQHLDYLFRSLQHHPSPYLIYEMDGSIKWANLAANYIFRMENLSDLTIKKIDTEEGVSKASNKDRIALSYETPVEVQLRNISFFIRTRVHLIPVEKSEGFLLIEVLCPSREGLEALQQTIACIEFDRIDLAYQKQVNLKTGKVTGIEALLRMRDEQGNIIPNDELIPQIEGEKVIKREKILDSIGRVRNIIEGPDVAFFGSQVTKNLITLLNSLGEHGIAALIVVFAVIFTYRRLLK